MKRKFSKEVTVLGLAGLLLVALFAAGGRAASPAAGPVKRSSSPIAITSDSSLLVTVNPDSNSVSLVNAVTLRLETETPVELDPRTVTLDDTGRRAFVANRKSDSVSAIDLATGKALAEIRVGHRPYGVLFSPAGDRVYVAEQGAAQVRILDAGDFRTLSLIPTEERPSGLAISDDGRWLYVTHLLTPVLSIIDVSLLPREGAAAPITEVSLFPDSNLAQAVVLSADRQRAYLPHTLSRQGVPPFDFTTSARPVVSVVDLVSSEHLDSQRFLMDPLDPPGVGLSFDAATTQDGKELWVLHAASNDLTVVDLISRERVAHIEVEDNPRGIVLSPDGARAFVNNTLAGTVSVIDTRTYRVLQTVPVTRIPLPPVLLTGKRLFFSSHDPRMSRAQCMSCSTCHFDGEHDGRTWNFIFSGPRNTPSLLGMVRTYPLRWSGEWDESSDVEYAIRHESHGTGLLEGDMECRFFPPDCVNMPFHQGRSHDLDSLAAFMDSLEMPLNPRYARGEPLGAAEKRGRQIFLRPDLGCAGCHPPPLYTDLEVHDVGTATRLEKIGPAYDTPSLLGLYDSAPYFHDGSARTLKACLTRAGGIGEHDLRGRLSDDELSDLVAFLLALPYE